MRARADAGSMWATTPDSAHPSEPSPRLLKLRSEKIDLKIWLAGGEDSPHHDAIVRALRGRRSARDGTPGEQQRSGASSVTLDGVREQQKQLPQLAAQVADPGV
jgi:hypothetical protein